MKRPPRPRNVGLVRVLSLLRQFQAHGRYRPEQLAARFHVTTRTIFRDLDTLQRAGYPLRSVRDRHRDGCGYWWLA